MSKKTLSIIDEVIKEPLYNNYFSRQLRDQIIRKGLKSILEDRDFITYLQSEDDYAQSRQLEEQGFDLTSDPYGVESYQTSNTKEPVLKSIISPAEDDTYSKQHNYNLLSVSISGFRKFPKIKDVRYGLVLGDAQKKHPLTTILYGGNGCGKSSFYDALQLWFTGSVTNNPDKQLHYASNTSISYDIEVETIDPFNADQSAIRNLLQAFFCSEHDINCIITTDSLQAYIYDQVGYGEAYRLYKHLERLHKSAVEVRYNAAVDKDATDEASTASRQVLINKLTSDIALMEEGLADTYTIIHSMHAEKDRNKIKAMFKSLHKTIKLSYNPETDAHGILTDPARNERFEELKLEINNIVNILRSERKTLSNMLPWCSFLLGKYDDLIRAFQGIPLDDANKHHLKVKSDFHKFMVSFDFTDKENKLNYHLQRVYNVIDKTDRQDKESVFFLEEAKKLIAKHAELNRLTGEENLSAYNKKLVQVDGHLYAFLQQYKQVFSSRVNAIISPMQNTIHTILSEFDMDSDAVKVTYDEVNAKLDINYEFAPSGSIVEALFSPRQYLNTHRLKIYGLTVKVALSFAIMKAYNFTFPLIFDDVIYASDFNNRRNVTELISNICSSYRKQCPGLPPLQIIFLTHDDVVFEAVASAFRDRNDYIQGRLFDYKDVEESDAVKQDNVMLYYNVYVRK